MEHTYKDVKLPQGLVSKVELGQTSRSGCKMSKDISNCVTETRMTKGDILAWLCFLFEISPRGLAITGDGISLVVTKVKFFGFI